MITTHLALFSFFNGMGGARAPAAASTDGGVRRVRHMYEPGHFSPKPREEKEERPQPAPQIDGRKLAEYSEKSAKLASAIEKLRTQTAQSTADAAQLRTDIAALEGQNKAKARAKAEHALMLKEQALTLAKAQETALLEEMEMVDIAYVAVIALGMILQ